MAQLGITVGAVSLRQTTKIMWPIKRFLLPMKKTTRWRPASFDLAVHLVEEIIIAF